MGKDWGWQDGKRAFDLLTGYYSMCIMGCRVWGVYLPSWSIYGTLPAGCGVPSSRLEETEGSNH